MDWKDLQAAAGVEGFKVVAGGDLFFTRWYLANGVLNDSNPDAAAPATGKVLISSHRVWDCQHACCPSCKTYRTTPSVHAYIFYELPCTRLQYLLSVLVLERGNSW
jgi:hypothetical protein